jgi:hypothetical protein
MQQAQHGHEGYRNQEEPWQPQRAYQECCARQTCRTATAVASKGQAGDQAETRGQSPRRSQAEAGGAESRAQGSRGKAGAFAREEAGGGRGGTAPELRRGGGLYIAARRGFAPGDPLADWVQAEAEIDRLMAEGRSAGEYAPVCAQAGSNTSAASGGRVSESEAGKPIQVFASA